MLSAYTLPHGNYKRRQQTTVDNCSLDSSLYIRKSVYHVFDRLEIDTVAERSTFETGQFTFLQESDGLHGTIYYPSNLPSFRVPSTDKKEKKRRKERIRDEMSTLLRSINPPLRQNLTTLLHENEQLRICELLGNKTEVVCSGIAQLLCSNGSSWEERSKGVVCYVKDYEMKTKSIIMVDPSSEKTTIVDAFKWNSISQLSMASHKFLMTFEVDGDRVMGLNFYSEDEASLFYRFLLEAHHKAEVRRSMRDTHRPKQSQSSKLSPLSQQSTSSRDSGITVDEPPKIKDQTKKKEKGKSIIGLFFNSSDKKKKKKEKKEKEKAESQSTFHVATPSSTSIHWNEGSVDRKMEWNETSMSSSPLPSSSLPSSSLPYNKIKAGAAFTAMWEDEGSSLLVSEFSADHLTIIPSPLPPHSTSTDYESSVAPAQLLLTTPSGSLDNAVIRNSIRVAKHTTPTARRATPKEIKSASHAKRADRQWDSSTVWSALPSPNSSTPPSQSRGPLPIPPRSRSPTPPLLPRHRSINNNQESTVHQSTTIHIQSSSSPLSPPPAYPPPPPPLTDAAPQMSDTTVASHRLDTVDDSPPPPPSPHRTQSASKVHISPSNNNVPPDPPLPPPVTVSSPPPPPPPPITTTTVSPTKNGAAPINDLLSQIRAVNKDNLLKNVDRNDRPPTTPTAGGGIMESLQKEIEKRRTVMNESSEDEDSCESDDSDWSE